MKRKILNNWKLYIIFLLAGTSAFSQESFTLKECINYALNQNSNVKVSQYNLTISDKKIDEEIGKYLPQLNIASSFDDNVKLPTSLLPAQLMGGPAGTFIPITFGNQYNFNTGLQLTQKLYDPTAILNIKNAKVAKNISELSNQKTKEETIYDICRSYYQTLVIKMQINVLNNTLLASNESLKSIELKYNNGVAKKIDADRIRVNFNNTNSQLDQSSLNYEQSLNRLKFAMGMPLENSIALTDTNLSNQDEILNYQFNNKYDYHNTLDYQINKFNLSRAEINKDISVSAFLPTLSLVGNYNYNAMRQEFTFFEGNKPWYQSSSFGLRLNIPIFDGMQRNYKYSQALISNKIADETLNLTEQTIKMNISNFEIQYKNALENIGREKENLSLAENVYKSSQLEYSQGMLSTVDLIQSESSYLISQNNYYGKLLSLYLARLDLEKAKGTLMTFINK